VHDDIASKEPFPDCLSKLRITLDTARSAVEALVNALDKSRCNAEQETARLSANLALLQPDPQTKSWDLSTTSSEVLKPIRQSKRTPFSKHILHLKDLRRIDFQMSSSEAAATIPTSLCLCKEPHPRASKLDATGIPT
jgi:hypothetical protein